MGGGLTLGSDVGVSIGILFDQDICTLKGGSTGFDFDLAIVEGAGFGAQFTDGVPAKVQLEFILKAGGAVNLGSVTRCQTFLSTSGNPDQYD